jgi:hypothetical protein
MVFATFPTSGVQKSQALRLPERLQFARWPIILMCPQYWTCFMSPFWCLEFGDGPYIFFFFLGKYMHPCPRLTLLWWYFSGFRDTQSFGTILLNCPGWTWFSYTLLWAISSPICHISWSKWWDRQRYVRHLSLYDDRSEKKLTWRIISRLKNLHWLWLHHGNTSPSDCHLFPAPKQNFGGHNFKDDGEVKTVVTRWLITQYTDWYRQGIEKLALRYDKCLSCGVDCVEIQWIRCTVDYEQFLLESKIHDWRYELILWSSLAFPPTTQDIIPTSHSTSVGHTTSTCYVAARVPRHVTSLPQPTYSYKIRGPPHVVMSRHLVVILAVCRAPTTLW